MADMGRGMVVTSVLDSWSSSATVSDVSTAGGVVLLSEPLADVSCSDSGTRGVLSSVSSWGVGV